MDINFKQLALDFNNQNKENNQQYNPQKKIDLIRGLNYIPEFISKQEEYNLIKLIDRQSWILDLKRRVQHYGYRYNYKSKKINRSMKIGEIPQWLNSINKKIVERDLLKELSDQIIINEYMPGQGITKHIDCTSCFTETIISLSLNSTCIMDFIEKSTNSKISVFLEPRSIVILQDDARYTWTHSIPARKSDIYQENKILRKRRISLTFRKVKLSP